MFARHPRLRASARWGAAIWGVAAGAALLAAFAHPARADEVVNLYTSRHYDTDERLYTEFTEKTGIKVNRIEDSASALIARIKAEGQNSPADLFITADAGMLWAAGQEGLLSPVDSALLKEKIPETFRHPEGDWYGFSARARIIFYDKARVAPENVDTYEELADPKNKGLVCTRSSGNIYMLSLMGAMIEHLGAEEAERWAAGLWDNRAREPAGGDTDQLKGIASGECGVALANHYYFVRAFRLDVPGLRNPEDTSKIGVLFPNQDSWGAHLNISGAGVTVHAPNRENAVKFLEYLASPSAQAYFAAGNSEFPLVEGSDMVPELAALGTFKADDLPLTKLGENQAEAQRIYDRVGYR
ncbi:MAG: extracellular solute-binding protein [Alphaproteobacteria bacterium]|nr:extracellular solute-binding protein [Alphaproteobacteria bacterium]